MIEKMNAEPAVPVPAGHWVASLFSGSSGSIMVLSTILGGAAVANLFFPGFVSALVGALIGAWVGRSAARREVRAV